MSLGNIRSLLIVDDEPELRNGLADLCLDLTSDVRTAANGQQAFDIIRTGSIDAVLSDIAMPIMNGLQLLAEVRYMGLETPFVFLTGYGDKTNTAEALRLGATDFLSKPVDENELLTIVDRALELGKTIREVEAELDRLYSASQLPADRLVHLKKTRRAIWMMRRGHAIYAKKIK